MRVVAAVPHYPPRSLVGAWMATHELLADLVAHGHDVTVLTTMSAHPAYELDGVDVLPMRRGRDLDQAVAAADVVISHLGDNGVAHRMALGHDRPSVRLVHGPAPDVDAMVGAALVVFNAEWHPTRALCPAPSIVVRPPVHIDRYETTSGDRVTLVNLSEAKGVMTAWRAAERLPEVPFLGVIGGYGEQHRPRCANWETIPTQQDMRNVYSRTRVLLMPSASESWGRVGVEAMCSGIPVIAHPTPGLIESLGTAGLFIDRHDIDSWVNTIRRLMTDHDRWTHQSRLAQVRAHELDPTDDLARFRAAIHALTTTQGAPQCAQSF